MSINRDSEIGSVLRRLSVLETREDTGGLSVGGWVDFTYTTGWTDFGTGAGLYEGGRYRKVGDIVYLEGLVKRTSGSSYVITTLPTGFRPANRHMFASNQGGSFGRVDIENNGEVIAHSSGLVTYVTLSGILFSTA